MSTASTNDENLKQLKYIASVVRALVTSRKHPSTLREILREYPEVESGQIPFRRLGYNSAEDLLRESGEFIFSRIGGETCITATYNTKTAHIASMVRSQKSAKSTRFTQKKYPIRQPRRSDQSWNKSSFSFNSNQSPTINRFIESQNRQKLVVNDRNNNSNKSNNHNNQQKQQLQRQKSNCAASEGSTGQQLQRQKSNCAASEGSTGQKDLRHLLNTKTQQNSASSNNNNNHNNNNNKKNNKINQGDQEDLRFLLNSKKEVQYQQQPQMQNRKMSDLSERLNNKQHQQHSQYQQQQKQKENTPRPILGQKNSVNVETATNDLCFQQQHQQHHQQHLLQNNFAVAIPKRDQEVLDQRQQNRAALLSIQQQQQNQYQQRFNYRSPTPADTPAAAANNFQYNSTARSSGMVGTGIGSIQDRLKIQIDNSSNKRIVLNGTVSSPELSPAVLSAGSERMQNPFDGQSNYQPQKQKESQSVIPPKVFEFNSELDPITSLSQYCVVRGYGTPEYTVFKLKFSMLYQCRMAINGSIFSTYPNEYSSEYKAKCACACQAIEEIRAQETRRNLPLCMDSDNELIEKIYKELLSHPHGMFAKNMTEWFEAKYQHSLPDHWWALVQKSSKFNTEKAACGKIIVFANLKSDKKDTQSVSGLKSTTVIKMDGITLPWSEKWWYLFITHCPSTVEVWARLFGKDYSDRFDSLLNEIDLHMLEGKVRPPSIACKHIYLVQISECWHRVRVEEMDKLNSTALCFFIDFGDVDWLSVNQLHVCEPKFLKLPPQAVPFSLFGLEDIAGHPYARRHLDTLLPNKSVVGEILTKEKDFHASESGKIQVVLHDTSSDEDVNLNPLILKQICDDTPAPELKWTGLTNVLVTYVSDAGDLYLQILNSELRYLQKLIQQLIESKFKREQHKVSRADLKSSNLFLICDDSDSGAQSQWYRGVLTDTCKSSMSSKSDEFDIFYVDNGQTRRTHISKIFNLDSLSTALSKFPRQTIKARLDNIPSISKNIVGRMRALMPPNCEVMVKMSSLDVVPLIIVYRRLEGRDTLCTINDVICIEHELELCSDACQTPEGYSTPAEGPRQIGFGGGVSPVSNSSLSPCTNSFVELTRGLTITTSVPISSLNTADLPRLKHYQAVPMVGDYFEVRVTMSANPSNFTIQPYKDYPHLRDLMKDLQSYCENNDEFIPVDMVEIGQAYAAKNPDGFYHRVTVVNTYSVDMIHVCFCDFGDIATLHNNQLKILPAKFRDLPKMAIQAKLYGISSRHVDWTLEDCLRFRALTVGQKFVSIIRRITHDKLNTSEAPILELDLVDVTTEEDVYIREILLKEDRAIEVTSSDAGAH